MVRSAAKNWNDVAVVIDAVAVRRRARRAEARRRGRAARRASRWRWPRSTASRTTTARSATTCRRSPTPTAARGRVPGAEQRPLRASCRTCATARTRTSARRSTATCTRRPASLVTAVQLQGKELSYNNIADADAAWECVKSFDALRLRDRQARQPVRRRARRDAGRGLREGVQDRPDLGLRRHHRVQPAARRRRRRRWSPSSSSRC